jgi:peptidoglycan/xylan/chitin deacetylase (PgdA/CDA1 family)
MNLPAFLRTLAYRSVGFAEAQASSLWLRFGGEGPGLVSFVFHRLGNHPSAYDRHEIHPQQKTSVNHFREFIACMLDAGYTFVRPQDLPACRSKLGRYAIITFDDGYFDNLLAVPVLEEFDVPAVFFISTRHVLEQKAFWSDVAYRHIMRQPGGPDRILSTFAELAALPTEQIEKRLIEQFGAECLRPLGDLDRPMTSAELAAFSRHRLVVIGNHTANHAILTLYPEDEIKTQIAVAQQHLLETTGQLPSAIAYPAGQFDARVVELTRQAGLSFGFTGVASRWGARELAEGDSLMIPRLALWGDLSIRRQCQQARTNWQWYPKLKRGAGRIAGW